MAELKKHYEPIDMSVLINLGRDELGSIHEELMAKKQKMQLLTSEALSLQSRATSLKKLLDDIQSRLPDLQQSKLMAVCRCLNE